jgi:ABC-2 type transport system ATP-binding protein
MDTKKKIAEVGIDDEHINVLIKILNKYNITSFKEKKFTLESYFMHFYERSDNAGGAA